MMSQSAETTLRVYEIIARNEPIGVTDISRRLNITKSKAQRCLNALNNMGWIATDEYQASTKWRITSKAFILGQGVTQQGRLREITMPFMKTIWDAIHESVHLAVAEGDKVLVIEQYESSDPMKMQIPRGAWAPMHIVASGKLFLAYSEKQFVSQYINKGLVYVTERTITDPEVLWKELEKIHEQGWSIAIDEAIKGASAAAAPVFGWDGRIIAALAITLPTVHFTEKAQQEYTSLLVDAAKEITRRLQEP